MAPDDFKASTSVVDAGVEVALHEPSFSTPSA